MEDIEKAFETRELSISLGPQHPATHGVLRLVLNLQGETVMKCTPYVGCPTGVLRSWERTRQYFSALPLSDRLDYISSMNNNVGIRYMQSRSSSASRPRKGRSLSGRWLLRWEGFRAIHLGLEHMLDIGV